MPWKKPAHLVPGTVWWSFQGRAAQPGHPPNKYMIRDVTPSEVEQCVDLMTREFLADEPICMTLETTSDPNSVATIQNNWRRFLSQGVGLACYREDAEGNAAELVAVNICIVKSKDDPEEMDYNEVVGESWRKVLRTLITAESTCDVFREFGVDAYLTSSGLVVRRSHRGHNIAVELLSAREPLCKALELRATVALMTATASQVSAARCGWRVLAEFSYSDMTSHGIDLTGSHTSCAKLMGTGYNY